MGACRFASHNAILLPRTTRETNRVVPARLGQSPRPLRSPTKTTGKRGHSHIGRAPRAARAGTARPPATVGFRETRMGACRFASHNAILLPRTTRETNRVVPARLGLLRGPLTCREYPASSPKGEVIRRLPPLAALGALDRSGAPPRPPGRGGTATSAARHALPAPEPHSTSPGKGRTGFAWRA